MQRRFGRPWARRGGATHGLAALTVLPANVSPPSLTGTTVTIGGSPVVTVGTWSGTPVLTYTLKRGVTTIAGPGASEATIEAYVFVAADVGPDITVIETDSVSSTAATSAAVRYNYVTQLPSPMGLHDLDATYVTAVGADVDIITDRSGLANHMQAASGLVRPSYFSSGFNGGVGAGNTAYMLGDGAAEYLRKAAADTGASNPPATTMLFVGKVVTPVASEIHMAIASTGAALRLRLQYAATGVRNSSLITSGTTANGTTDPTADEAVYWCRWTGALNQIGTNNAQEASQNAVTAPTDIDGGVFSLLGSNTGTLLSNTQIAWAGFLGDDITTAQLADFVAYATWRWGL